MKHTYFCGCFTINGEIRTAIRHYSSIRNANTYFAKEVEKTLGDVIYSFAKAIDDFNQDDKTLYFDVFTKELYRDGMWTLKTFYPNEYSQIYGGV